MKIAVTSASGQLGSAIVEQLIKEIGKDNVIGIARTPEKAQHLGVEIRQGDYNNPQDFDKAFQGVDTALLVSGMDVPQKRIQQHRNVIEAAKQNDVRKLVYTSIIGSEEGNTFSPVVRSNRQTEQDIMDSGLNWAVGRNGLYIEPDLEYIDKYQEEGGIVNCAGEGLCAYTSKGELAYAYSKMLIENKGDKKIYNLTGEPISQSQLADYINQVYYTKLTYRSVSVEEYLKRRKAALGEFMGTVIGGIYEGIKMGVFNVDSDFEAATGRAHKLIHEIISEYKSEH